VVPLSAASRPARRRREAVAAPTAPDPSAAVRCGYAQARRIARRRARNFYVAFLGQRPGPRRALYAIYAFCRQADDVADDGRATEDAREGLRELRARLARIYEGEPARPLDDALQHAILTFGIRRRDFETLLRGIERDLAPRRYETFDELYAYCFEVAASVGLLCLPVFGRHDALARRHAVDLGIGMQLTNILRDLAEDTARDRVYLPLADLRRFGMSEADLAGGLAAADQRVAALVRFEAARARRFLRSGCRLLPLLEPRERFCPAVLGDVYGELLDRIERSGAGVLGRRVTVPWARKLWLALRAFTAARAASFRTRQVEQAMEKDPGNETAETLASAGSGFHHPRA
jgi:phytoene synthase